MCSLWSTMSSRSSMSESRGRGFSIECRRNDGWQWSVSFVTAPVTPAQTHHAAVGAGDAGEPVSGAHALDRLSRPLRPLHRLDDLELARGRLDGRGAALLVATPVAPAGPVAHRPRA